MIDFASNSGPQHNVSSFSWSHTCTGSDLFLFVDIMTGNTQVPVSTVIYNGIALTLVAVENTSGIGRIETWVLENAPNGTYNVDVTLGTEAGSAVGLAVSYTDVSGIANITTDNGQLNAKPAVLAIPVSNTDSWVRAAVISSDKTITSDQTERNNVASYPFCAGACEDSNGPVSVGTATLSFSAISRNNNWGMIGLELIKA